MWATDWLWFPTDYLLRARQERGSSLSVNLEVKSRDVCTTVCCLHRLALRVTRSWVCTLGATGGTPWGEGMGRLKKKWGKQRFFALQFWQGPGLDSAFAGKSVRSSDIRSRTGGHKFPCFSLARRRLMSSPWWGPLDSPVRAWWSEDLCQLSCWVKLWDQLFLIF